MSFLSACSTTRTLPIGIVGIRAILGNIAGYGSLDCEYGYGTGSNITNGAEVAKEGAYRIFTSAVLIHAGNRIP